MPKYSSSDPARSRIRVYFDELKDIYVPALAGESTEVECPDRHTFIIAGKEYDQCSFCRFSCPSRDIFKDPDSGLPLKCDMCQEGSSLTEPMCVQWCVNGTLTLEEREEEGEEEEKPGEMGIGLEVFVKKHGLKTLRNTRYRSVN